MGLRVRVRPGVESESNLGSRVRVRPGVESESKAWGRE